MFDKYLIKSTDTLESIAKKYHTTIDNILDLNNVRYLSDLRVGNEIIVPKEKEAYFNTYLIEKGDNLYSIARRYNINPSLLASLNGLNMDDYIYPNEQILIPKSGYSYYITAPGDTLELVAKEFGVSKDKLLNENETVYLMEGQLLVNRK